MTTNIYLENSLGDSERLIGMMDKNPMSKTFGCFDKNYWHHRFTDFPSAIKQQGVLCLCLLYQNKNSPFYKEDYLLKLIEGALEYAIEIQKGDGSYDEWYPNERGWAGPTGYIAYALGRTYELLEEDLNDSLKAKLRKSLLKSARFLAFGWEAHVLSNHIAMALLPIKLITNLFDSKKLDKQYELLFNRFMDYFCKEEGWGVEYDGPDIGYQSATVSFLARLHRYDQNYRIEEVCKSSLNFIKYFCYPDNSFSRKLGSRQCEVLFHYGIEYWSQREVKSALAIGKWSENSLLKNMQLIPRDHEDHYFIYRMLEFLETGFEFKPKGLSSSGLPFEGNDFKKTFQKGLIYVSKRNGQYQVINIGRGGASLFFDCDNKKLLKANFGLMVETSKGKQLTSLEFNKDISFHISEEQIEIEGELFLWKAPLFNPIKMIIFKKMMLVFGWNASLSYGLKKIIRKLLLNLDTKSEVLFNRKISLLENTITSHLINNEGLGIEKVYEGGLFDIRFVPQSRYFKISDGQKLFGS